MKLPCVFFPYSILLVLWGKPSGMLIWYTESSPFFENNLNLMLLELKYTHNLMVYLFIYFPDPWELGKHANKFLLKGREREWNDACPMLDTEIFENYIVRDSFTGKSLEWGCVTWLYLKKYQLCDVLLTEKTCSKCLTHVAFKWWHTSLLLFRTEVMKINEKPEIKTTELKPVDSQYYTGKKC